MPRDACMEWMRGVRGVRVTYCTPGGQRGGVAMEILEEVLVSGFHCMGQTMSFSGMMGSGSSSVSSGVCRQDRASALVFLGPGR